MDCRGKVGGKRGSEGSGDEKVQWGLTAMGRVELEGKRGIF